MKKLPDDWQSILKEEVKKPYYTTLRRFVATEREHHQVFPPENEVFAALEATSFSRTRVLLLGQDPYHGEGQAHGLCFSVRPGIRPPRSLVNILAELKNDLGCPIPNHGSLQSWADQGVLLLNAVLTVRAHQPNSHKNQGWEIFTDAIIQSLSTRAQPVVFALWGGFAQKKAALIEAKKHPLLLNAHPSPLSARRGFFGSKPFSKINQALQKIGQKEIDWAIPDL